MGRPPVVRNESFTWNVNCIGRQFYGAQLSVSMPCMVPTEMYYLVCGRHDSGRMIDRITKSVSVTIKSVGSNSIHGEVCLIQH